MKSIGQNNNPQLNHTSIEFAGAILGLYLFEMGHSQISISVPSPEQSPEL